MLFYDILCISGIINIRARKSESKMLEISDFATPTIMSVVSGVAKRIMPLFDRVLIQRAAAETKTKGGL